MTSVLKTNKYVLQINVLFSQVSLKPYKQAYTHHNFPQKVPNLPTNDYWTFWMVKDIKNQNANYACSICFVQHKKRK